MADSGLGVKEENTRASSPASINSLQIALFSLKDRCTKQQKRIDELEGENMVLNNSRADLYTDLKKLHEANVKLREKNLSLSHELHMRSKENCEMKVQWDKDRSRNRSNVKQLERLQKDVIQRSARTISMEENDSEDDTIASMKYEVAKDTSEVDVVQDEEMKTLVDTGADTMTQIKQNLQIQLAAAVQKADNTNNPAGRCCPMCEAVFPMETSQEEFEGHVVEHFSYEESDTLRNFDTVPDAFWPGIEHDPETMGGM